MAKVNPTYVDVFDELRSVDQRLATLRVNEGFIITESRKAIARSRNLLERTELQRPALPGFDDDSSH